MSPSATDDAPRALESGLSCGLGAAWALRRLGQTLRREMAVIETTLVCLQISPFVALALLVTASAVLAEPPISSSEYISSSAAVLARRFHLKLLTSLDFSFFKVAVDCAWSSISNRLCF